MSKRKSNKSSKPDALERSGSAKPASRPKPAVSASMLAISEAEELQAAPETETKLPELPGHEIDSTLPPVPPPELESRPTLPDHLAEPKLDVALPAGVLAETRESAPADAGEASTASLSLRAGGPLDATLESSLERPSESSLEKPFESTLERPLTAVAGIEAYQTLLMEMTRDNLDFAASLASMRSPLDIIDVATKFAGRRIGIYGRFSKAVVDITAGRQAPMT